MHTETNVIHFDSSFVVISFFFQSDPLNEHSDVIQSKNGDQNTAEGKIKLNSQGNGNIFNKYSIYKVIQMSRKWLMI